MSVEPPPQRRSVGFKRVRNFHDLRPFVNAAPPGRRVDHAGNYLGPLRALTTDITSTYNLCNKQFRYETAHNPRRVLTKPSRPVHNDGFDNEDYDYILYVNDWLGSEDGQKYLILDVLGQGTFGQVVKCQNAKTNEILAVKVIKNKPAYFNQSMMEVTILQMLNNDHDPHDEHHILRLRDSFIHKNHLCLVFEQLSSNLYELIKQNQFQGLSTQLVKVFTAQLLDALTVLKNARLIHCDLKPENILLKSLQSPQIKVIDFGSACHERQTVYTYIQSRFYRSPEVLLGIPYTAAIDMWSLGCIAVELFLGLPLFPGTSEYNQITRIVELLGLPPQQMLDHGKQVSQFFDRYVDTYGHAKYRLKSIEQYSRERNTQEQAGKQYFSHKTLPEIIRHAPLASSRQSSVHKQAQEVERENNNRAAFIDFCQGLLNLNPLERWTPQQAKLHPFITGEKFTRPFNVRAPSAPVISSSTSPAADPKRPYGGLLPSQPKGNRAYQDAASYNQQLAQHQAYTAQAQAASQTSANAMRNPYVAQQQAQSYNDANTDYGPQQPQQQHNAASSQLGQQPAAARQVNHQVSSGSLGLQYAQGASGLPVPATNPHPPANSYFPSSRARANTINQMDVVPPALARLQQMGNPDVTGIGRNALTPVMQREDAMREWERRQSGKAHPPPQTYPQLEFLQQQAELAATSGLSWGQTNTSNTRYAPSNLSYQSQPASVSDDRTSSTMRDAVMSSVRTAARQDVSNSLAQAGVISAPPQAYSSTTNTTANRYGGGYQQTPATYEQSSYDTRSDGTTLYMPVQSQQYQPYSNTSASPSHSQQPPPSQQGMATRHTIVPTVPSVSQSFYSPGVVASGQPFSGPGSPNPPQQGLQKDTRRMSGMDVWQR
ncbi:kinase-like domain-containing protein [Hysterangium stoloniferum]|nr:kinase-like domain-containing protein [Hysterangium stoloniferum]